MSDKIFENIGKELDAIVEKSVEALNEFDKAVKETIKEETSKKKMKKREKQFTSFVDDLDKEFSSFINSMQEDIKVSKIKIFNIRMKDFEKAVIKYKKKSNKISIGKEGSDKHFDILLVDDISKKQVKKILASVNYNEETNIINITAKRKFLKKS